MSGFSRYRLGCDIGGTFTDFIVLDSQNGEIHVHKRLTTPDDPARGVLQGLDHLADGLPGFIERVDDFIHGTTLVSNAVIERKGVRTALLVTEGFRDVLQLRRQNRTTAYDIAGDVPEPVIPRNLTFEISERINSAGSVLRGVDEASVRRVWQDLASQKVQSVAVCLLHAYRKPIHEHWIREALRAEFGDLPVSLSSEVLPVVGEYERASTTAINAYVQPIVAGYLKQLSEALQSRGFVGRFFLMLSSGSLTSVEVASAFPVRLIESGPAAGVMAAALVGRLSGIRDVLSFDMGGTTAKGCLLKGDCVPIASNLEVDRVYRCSKGSGLPVSIPAVDLIEIGAGGGSIARINKVGLLQVGPDSAGARPGPICYALGGQEPTVTDCDLILGYLNPSYFLGGEMSLDPEAAGRGLAMRVAEPLGLSLLEAAWGVHDLVNETMASSLIAYLAERGADARSLSMVAFGGAGPVHAYHLAAKLHIPRLVIPRDSGVASAWGFFAAAIAFEVTQTYKVGLTEADMRALRSAFESLEATALDALSTSGVGSDIVYRRSIQMQYQGQSHCVEIVLPRNGTPTVAQILDAFSAEYRQCFGFFYSDVPIELVNIRVVASFPSQPLGLPPADLQNRAGTAFKGKRPAYNPVYRRYVEHNVYDRYLLRPGEEIRGPAIVEERESTAIIGEGGCGRLDEYGLLQVTVGGNP